MKYEHNTTAQAIVEEIPRIAKDEGLVLRVYKDGGGYPTFGFGTLVKPGMPEYGKPIGYPVSEQRCLEAFLSEFFEEVYPDTQKAFGRGQFNKLPFAAKKVFANVLYNMGLTRFRKFKRTRAAVLARNWDRAADELLDSKYARQVKSRATRLAGRLRKV